MQCETQVSLEVSTLIHISQNLTFFLIISLFFYPISGDESMSQSVETHTMTMAEN